jgi:hypothetical protein
MTRRFFNHRNDERDQYGQFRIGFKLPDSEGRLSFNETQGIVNHE